MDLFMEKPVNRDKLRAMLDLLESDSWQRGDTAAESGQPPVQRAQQQPLPGLGFAGGQRCASLSSFSGGLDIKVRCFARAKLSVFHGRINDSLISIRCLNNLKAVYTSFTHEESVAGHGVTCGDMARS